MAVVEPDGGQTVERFETGVGEPEAAGDLLQASDPLGSFTLIGLSQQSGGLGFEQVLVATGSGSWM